jgi:hydroxymethylbilane synthase
VRWVRGIPLKAPLRIGARGSPLSLAQTGSVARELEAASPGLAVQIVPIRTRGDDPGRAPLGAAGIKGLFVKEIEDALLLGAIDLAVHSAKDLPSALPEGLALGAAPRRASPFDALIAEGAAGVGSLKKGARVGTSSLRRRAQLLALRPDLAIVPLRGNLDTRLGKVVSGELDATLLGASGLRRLKGEAFPVSEIPPGEILPAPGQGQLALELREGDEDTLRLCAPLNHALSEAALACERAFMAALGAGCQTPAAAWARIEGGAFVASSLVCELDGSRTLKAEGRLEGFRAIPETGAVSPPSSVAFSEPAPAAAGGPGGAGGSRGSGEAAPDLEAARGLGRSLAERLLEAGAAEIIARAERGI